MADNGDKTFLRITNKMIYEKIELIEKKLSLVVTTEDCVNHRKSISGFGKYVITTIISVGAIIISIFSIFKGKL